MSKRTALVTGASDGIGGEFIKILASRDYNLILVARREDRLNDLADEVSSRFGVQCHVIALDLSGSRAAQDLFNTVEKKGFKQFIRRK